MASLRELFSVTASRNLAAGPTTVMSSGGIGSGPTDCRIMLKFAGLDGSGGDFTFTVRVGGFTIQPAGQVVEFGVQVNSKIPSHAFTVYNFETVEVDVTSPNAADNAVTVTATLEDVSPLQSKVKGRGIDVTGDENVIVQGFAKE